MITIIPPKMTAYWVIGIPSSAVQQLKCEADNSYHSVLRLTIVWNFTIKPSTCPHETLFL
jgi:hypothetical protein